MADDTDTPRIDPLVLLLVFLWLAMPLAAMPVARSMWPAGPPPPTPGQIDPNTAPWWELALLPRIGMATAFDIIQYR